MPQFYKQLLDMWYSINNVEPETISEVLNESIWLNERILVGNVPIHNKKKNQGRNIENQTLPKWKFIHVTSSVDGKI